MIQNLQTFVSTIELKSLYLNSIIVLKNNSTVKNKIHTVLKNNSTVKSEIYSIFDLRGCLFAKIGVGLDWDWIGNGPNPLCWLACIGIRENCLRNKMRREP